jgi:hypothetical protein
LLDVLNIVSERANESIHAPLVDLLIDISGDKILIENLLD